jgi:hypothetical protein
MFEFSESKKKAWLHFFEQLGILEKYEGVFKRKLNEKSSWDLFSPNTSEKEQIEFNKRYLEKHPPLNEVIPSANEILSENSNKIKHFNGVFIDYNSFPPYSLEKSKEVIIKSIEKLTEKYGESGVPLVYTTLKLPSPANFPSHTWRELFNNLSFNKEDYGNVDFIQTLLDLKKDGVINIYFFEILFFDNSNLVIKAVVHYKKKQKSSTAKVKSNNQGSEDKVIFQLKPKDASNILFKGWQEKRLAENFAKKIGEQKLPYEKDGLIYSLWKYSNAYRLTGKNLISFMDLAPLEENPRFTTFHFLSKLKALGIELENITFHLDIYKKYCKDEYDFITAFITKYQETDFSDAVGKLFKNQATFSEVFRILGEFDEFVKVKAQLNGLLEFIEFSPSPSKKNIEPLKGYLEQYIQCFIEDKLFSLDLKNFYKFSRQKEVFLQQIEREVKDYGFDFVFRQGKIVSIRRGSSASIGEDASYLFIHTLAALEKQGLFEAESIIITDMDVPPEKQTNDYKVKILGSEKLLRECEPENIRARERTQKPIPIQIVAGSKIEVEKNDERAKFKFPDKLPRGTKWKNITIKFIDDDNVEITAKGKEHTENYKGMGFAGKKDASVLWLFLKILAKYYGEIVSSDPDANDKFKKQKELLSEKLENYFRLDYADPFHPFQIEGKSEKSYRTKFQLIPPDDGFSFEKKAIKPSPKVKGKKNPFEDLQDFMNEEAPIVAQIEKTEDGEIT